MSLACSRVQRLIPEAAEGNLDESLRAELFSHADVCNDCACALDLQIRLHREIATAPLAAPPALYFEGVLAQIHRKMPPVPGHAMGPSRRLLPPEAIPTAIMIAALALWFMTNLLPMLPERIGSDDKASASGGLFSRGARATSASLVAARRIVLVQGFGGVSVDSGIFDLSAETLEEIGMPPGYGIVELRLPF